MITLFSHMLCSGFSQMGTASYRTLNSNSFKRDANRLLNFHELGVDQQWHPPNQQ